MKQPNEYTDEEIDALRTACRDRLAEAVLDFKVGKPGPISEDELMNLVAAAALRVHEEHDAPVSLTYVLTLRICKAAQADQTPAKLVTYGVPGRADYVIQVGSIFTLTESLN